MGHRRRAKRIGISGSYGGLNLGDEAILGSIVAQLRRAEEPLELIVFSRNAEDTRTRHAVDDAVPVRELTRVEAQRIIEGLDLFILGGGGIIFDGEAELYLRELNLAREASVPSMVYSVSVGPLKDQTTRRRVREAFEHADVVSVRDRASQRLLDELGVKREVVLTADPALLLEPEPLTMEEILRAEAIDPDKILVGFSVREPGPAAPDLTIEHYHTLVANAADFMVDRLGAEVVFVPMERRNFDVQHSHGVVAMMRHAARATVLKREYTPGQLLSLLRHFRFSVGMRLHFLIFSALAEVPFAALPYASKVTGLLRELDLSAPSLEGASAGQLIAYIDRTWDMREQVQRHVTATLPTLQERARSANELALDLLRRPRFLHAHP